MSFPCLQTVVDIATLAGATGIALGQDTGALFATCLLYLHHTLCTCVTACLQTVVDIATLTGAAGIALGQDTGALFANDDALAASLDAASRRAGALAS